MLERLRQMLIKEFLQILRDPRGRFVLFVPLILQMLIFGYAATFELHRVPLAVLDLDHSYESRDLVSRFSSRAISSSAPRHATVISLPASSTTAR